jgi:hypothetical protein
MQTKNEFKVTKQNQVVLNNLVFTHSMCIFTMKDLYFNITQISKGFKCLSNVFSCSWASYDL